MTPGGIRAASRHDASTSTASVRRLRLFTPMSPAPLSTARDSSSSSCTSTSAARPSSAGPRLQPHEVRLLERGHDQQRRHRLRPRALRTAGTRRRRSPCGAAACPRRRAPPSRCSSAPSKNVGSVSTEIAAAPPLAYCARDGDRVVDRRQHPARRRAALALGDDVDAPAAAERCLEQLARAAWRPRRGVRAPPAARARARTSVIRRVAATIVASRSGALMRAPPRPSRVGAPRHPVERRARGARIDRSGRTPDAVSDRVGASGDEQRRAGIEQHHVARCAGRSAQHGA